MASREISLDMPAATRSGVRRMLDRFTLTSVIVGALTAASILLLIYQENRAVQYRIDATEVWSAYQVKIVQAATEEDPNLKTQYAEEQDVLRQHSLDLKETSNAAKHAVVVCTYAALFFLLGSAAAVFALFAKSVHAGYAALVLSIIGVAVGIRSLF